MSRIPLKSAREIETMRRAGGLVAETFRVLEPYVQPGVTLKELDRRAEEFIRGKGAKPAYLGYGPRNNPFPGTICASVNEVICHGIPDDRELRDGDILGMDIGVLLDGYYGDACTTYTVGQVSDEVRALVDTTRACLQAGLDEVRPGAKTGDIGHAIQSLAESRGYGVVREYTGHGIGKRLHEDPTIYHWGVHHTGLKLQPGMVFTIEPMINLGTPETRLLADGWTVITADKKPSAQFEHTLVVTPKGYDILTL
ncbi:type I methionyl aminopeptidase [Deinococcus radiodurans]|jgi:methionine aminopeptidase, type I (EC 3.4.11.18)|nr:type I methionyl aminopeptidase [Deinococcus radiodurans]ANC71530.1 type I methionyl aminopeptidase [Deinococcus radiodurans R1 = ATCC 13939 = DSM 20539]QIP29355.1 type I methionyl aminopeptidase [Deinococcus radiodurans]QIP31949.1 type I methionyl aminopeptidase [Deinococcus radiodurans]UID70299.1 type I methionyl aminopeptidase [Deinococcus radiodurans R1 = ATCC 13939 = DSM 20539]UTA50791.1 type I methionyl aminopeptidase [Deinococcus radiodurans]